MTTADLIEALRKHDPDGLKQVAYVPGLTDDPLLITGAWQEEHEGITYIALH